MSILSHFKRAQCLNIFKELLYLYIKHEEIEVYLKKKLFYNMRKRLNIFWWHLILFYIILILFLQNTTKENN